MSENTIFMCLYIYKVIKSNQKEQTTDICNNMDECQKH